jgi:hypothetical protein
MPRRVDLAELVSCSDFAGESPEDDTLVKEIVARGRSYVQAFDWCSRIVECYIGDIAIGDVVAVLLLRIEPERGGVDDWL